MAAEPPQSYNSEARQLKADEECRGSQPYNKNWDTGKLLGRGAFGDVNKVTTDKGITCAAKTIRLPVQVGSQQANLDDEIKQFVHGEKNLSKLIHPNIVRFLWIEQRRDNLVLFMEIIDGETLGKKINGNPLDETNVACYTYQICSALDYMHIQQPPVIHRDINCNNIMVLHGSDRIKLIDFGLSIRMQRSFTHYSTDGKEPTGTYNFLAPELFGSSDESENTRYSRESDIWAFGCVIYQMATGSPPHACCHILSLALRLKEKGAPDLPSSCSTAMIDFYRRCVEQEPTKRESATELLNDNFLSAERERESGVSNPSTCTSEEERAIEPETENREPAADQLSLESLSTDRRDDAESIPVQERSLERETEKREPAADQRTQESHLIDRSDVAESIPVQVGSRRLNSTMTYKWFIIRSSPADDRTFQQIQDFRDAATRIIIRQHFADCRSCDGVGIGFEHYHVLYEDEYGLEYLISTGFGGWRVHPERVSNINGALRYLNTLKPVAIFPDKGDF